MFQLIGYGIAICLMLLPFVGLYYTYVPFRVLFGQTLGVYAWLLVVMVVSFYCVSAFRFHTKKRVTQVSAEKLRQTREAELAAGISTSITEQQISESSGASGGWSFNPQFLLYALILELLLLLAHLITRK